MQLHRQSATALLYRIANLLIYRPSSRIPVEPKMALPERLYVCVLDLAKALAIVALALHQLIKQPLLTRSAFSMLRIDPGIFLSSTNQHIFELCSG